MIRLVLWLVWGVGVLAGVALMHSPLAPWAGRLVSAGLILALPLLVGLVLTAIVRRLSLVARSFLVGLFLLPSLLGLGLVVKYHVVTPYLLLPLTGAGIALLWPLRPQLPRTLSRRQAVASLVALGMALGTLQQSVDAVDMVRAARRWKREPHTRTSFALTARAGLLSGWIGLPLVAAGVVRTQAPPPPAAVSIRSG